VLGQQEEIVRAQLPLPSGDTAQGRDAQLDRQVRQSAQRLQAAIEAIQVAHFQRRHRLAAQSEVCGIEGPAEAVRPRGWQRVNAGSARARSSCRRSGLLVRGLARASATIVSTCPSSWKAASVSASKLSSARLNCWQASQSRSWRALLELHLGRLSPDRGGCAPPACWH
jgi:hypothetical protein